MFSNHYLCLPLNSASTRCYWIYLRLLSSSLFPLDPIQIYTPPNRHKFEPGKRKMLVQKHKIVQEQQVLLMSNQKEKWIHTFLTEADCPNIEMSQRSERSRVARCRTKGHYSQCTLLPQASCCLHRYTHGAWYRRQLWHGLSWCHWCKHGHGSTCEGGRAVMSGAGCPSHC